MDFLSSFTSLHIKILQVPSLVASCPTIALALVTSLTTRISTSAVFVPKTLNIYSSPYFFPELCTCISTYLFAHHHPPAPQNLKVSMLKNKLHFCPLFPPGPNPTHFLYPSHWKGHYCALKSLLSSTTSLKTQILSILVLKKLLNVSSPLQFHHNYPGFNPRHLSLDYTIVF